MFYGELDTTEKNISKEEAGKELLPSKSNLIAKAKGSQREVT